MAQKGELKMVRVLGAFSLAMTLGFLLVKLDAMLCRQTEGNRELVLKQKGDPVAYTQSVDSLDPPGGSGP
jgi:hypothetical protein